MCHQMKSTVIQLPYRPRAARPKRKEVIAMSIVEPSVLELLKHSESRYTLVVEASKRGRQLVSGAQPMIDAREMKPLKVAVEEINRGLLSYTKPEDANAPQEA